MPQDPTPTPNFATVTFHFPSIFLSLPFKSSAITSSLLRLLKLATHQFLANPTNSIPPSPPSNLTQMASSVARMPPPAADDWRNPSRLLHHHPLSINLRKVLVRDPVDDPRPAGDASPATVPPPSPATAARRRQSQILDRWAARQARGMITTIERQAHDAELSALSSSSQPVSARAACFNPSFSSSTTAPPPSIAAPPPPPLPAPAPIPSVAPSNVKASSLIQMWRELEAESGVPPTPRAAGNSASVNNAASSPRSISSDSEQTGDWESDATAINSASQTESDRGRVENLIRLLSAGNATEQSSVASSWSEEVDSAVAREQQQHVGVDDLRDGSVVASPRANALRVRGRREIAEVMLRLEQERRKELEKLIERQAVSRFPHRGRLQVSN